MMIDPETYYEENLKGKSAEQILSKIRGLKKEIGYLQNIVENPYYKCQKHPSEAVQIMCLKLYLDRAKEAYEEIGCSYALSKAEARAKEFDNNLSYIEKIVFTEESFFGGFASTTCSTVGGNIKIELNKSGNFSLALQTESVAYCSKVDFIRWLKEIRIGEWKIYYNGNRFDDLILDGTSWELSITFSNSTKPFKIRGYESYPYNFSKLKDIFSEILDSEY